MQEVIQNRVINRNVNIAIFDGDSRGAGPKKFYRNLPHAEHELDPFISDNPSFVKLVGLFIDQVTILLNVGLDFGKYLRFKVNFRIGYFLVQLF